MLYTNHQFSNNFCQDMAVMCLGNINTRTSFNLVAMQGVGVTFFLRHLQNRSTDEFIYINSFEMHEFTRDELHTQLARKLELTQSDDSVPNLQAIGESLKNRTAEDKKVVIVFNRFDRFGPLLGQGLYDTLRFLRDVDRNQIIMMFVTGTPLIERLGQNTGDILSLVTNTTYFPGYSLSDLQEIGEQTGTPDFDDKSLALCGGNHSLLQILWRCQDLDNPLSDPMVELFIKGLYFGLNPSRRKAIDAVANGKKASSDSYLRGVSFVKETLNGWECFTPLLCEYVKRLGKSHLPIKERRLLQILQIHTGELVHKQTIFDFVWAEEDGIASEWALNALVYRLRRHSAFDSARFSIESRKKQGYVLHDIRE